MSAAVIVPALMVAGAVVLAFINHRLPVKPDGGRWRKNIE